MLCYNQPTDSTAPIDTQACPPHERSPVGPSSPHMRLAECLTGIGASCYNITVCLVGETLTGSSRCCRNVRVYNKTITAMSNIEYTHPSAPPRNMCRKMPKRSNQDEYLVSPSTRPRLHGLFPLLCGLPSVHVAYPHMDIRHTPGGEI